MGNDNNRDSNGNHKWYKEEGENEIQPVEREHQLGKLRRSVKEEVATDTQGEHQPHSNISRARNENKSGSKIIKMEARV